MLVILSVLAAVSPASVPRSTVEARPICHRTSVYADGARATVRRLDQEPPAELLLGVLRLRDGCENPIVIRRDVGSPPAATAMTR